MVDETTTPDDESRRLIAEMEQAAAEAAKLDQGKGKRGPKTPAKPVSAPAPAPAQAQPATSESLKVAAGVRVVNHTYRPYRIITAEIPAHGEYVLTAEDVQDERLVSKVHRCIELGIMSLGAA